MRVFWHNAEKTILVRELSQEWTWEEYQLSVLRKREMLREVGHGVYVIIDASQTKVVPSDALHQLLAGNRDLPTNVLMRFLVLNNKLLYELYLMLLQISPTDFEKFYFVSTLETAFQRISEAQNPIA